MICEKCGKRKASVHIESYVNGVYKERHLCSVCAREEQEGYDSMNTAGFLSSMFAPPSSTAKKCKACGLTEKQFLKSGYLGCSECYETFKDSVESLVRKVQGSTAHIGRTPTPTVQTSTPKSELERLTEELNLSLKNEDYQTAVILRDKIKKLKEGK